MRKDHLEYTIEEFMRVAEEQEKKGMKKYGKPLDPEDLKYDWLEMALEENVDSTKYLTAEIKKRQFIVERIRRIIEQEGLSTLLQEEIHFWLDALEGK